MSFTTKDDCAVCYINAKNIPHLQLARIDHSTLFTFTKKNKIDLRV